MARERWFYAQNNQRKGPMRRLQLVQALVTLPEPRSYLVWRRGLPAWTKAGEVPELSAELPSLVPEPAAKEPSRPSESTYAAAPGGAGTGSEVAEGHGTAVLQPTSRITAVYPLRRVERRRPRVKKPLIYAAGAALLAISALGAWAFWSRGGRGQAAVDPASAAAREADLPESELSKLRGVAGWAGNKLTVTLYNGSPWRVTELLVRTSRLQGDRFVDAPSAHRFLPVQERVDAGVAEILKKVAPDQRKPGVNPMDAGAFEAIVGPQPEAYRWTIEGAKGYPPQPEP